jgi:uncharacterized protein (DUF2141 family)
MKKTISLSVALVSGLLFMTIPSQAQAQTTQVLVSGIRSGNGQLLLNVFKDNETYDKEKPFKTFAFDKKGLADGKLVVPCALEPGVYGITLVDDENGNGKIDKNLVGMPKEGFGFSNFFMEKMKKPVFNDFKVDLSSANARVEIKVKYM